jgi:phosphoglucosamine mutase
MGQKPLLFGTDGMRGVAGSYPLNRDTVWKLGRALGEVLGRTASSRPLQLVLGEDTRESSAGLSRALAAGLESTGVSVLYAGVITTPGVAFLTRHHGLAGGVMVSASHNPYQDNGIKILSSAGTKLPETFELELERELERGASSVTPDPSLEPSPKLLSDYLEFLAGLLPPDVDISKYKLVVDCANGAAARVAPRLLERLGIKARILHADPNGRNINFECGSLHPEEMAAQTQSSGADLGVAFDGDADRAIFATGGGRIADGDHVLFAVAPFLKRRRELKGDAVVGTLMTNLGLELALAEEGIGLKRTPVGDKYVLEEMLRSGINLGGEPSGHIIFSEFSLAGDGLITLLEMLRLLAETRDSLDRLVDGFKPFPHVIRNVRVREKPPLESVSEVRRAIDDCRREFGERGRVVVRYSGTEPLARVMVEGELAEAVERHSERIAEAIRSVLGAS